MAETIEQRMGAIVLRNDVSADLASEVAKLVVAAEQRGYARCQADVVAWLRSDESVAQSSPDEAFLYVDDVERAFANAAVLIESGAHVGAAQNGGE